MEKCYNTDIRFEYLNRVGDFALARDKENNELVLIYSYDCGYEYHVISVNELFDIDTDKILAEWLNAIGKMITSNRPYANNWGKILSDAMKEGERHE